MWIAEADQRRLAVDLKGHDDGEGSVDYREGVTQRRYDIVCRVVTAAARHQRIGKDAQHGFDVASGQEIDGALGQSLTKSVIVRHVPVMGHDDAWSPLEEGLCVGEDSSTDSRVAHVPDADVSTQSFECLVVEDILYQAKASVAGEVVTGEREDPTRILSAVLNGLQCRAQVSRHGPFVNNSGETTHREGL